MKEIEKAYIIFLWIANNIEYNIELKGKITNELCEPINVYKTGKTVCAGYSSLYKDFADYLKLKVENVTCFCKGADYYPGNEHISVNHEYNVININDIWFPIDSTWGAGKVGSNGFEKQLDDFYFLADPELIKYTHFPVKEKWRLTKKKYYIDNFIKWPKISSTFFNFKFFKFFPEDEVIELDNSNNLTFKVWKNGIIRANVHCIFYMLDGNIYRSQNNSYRINILEDKAEIECIFNKKGKYRIDIYGNKDGGRTTYSMIIYIVKVNKDAPKNLSFKK